MSGFSLKAPNLKQRARVKVGAKNERFVGELNKLCQLKGVASIRKIPTPFKVIGSNGGILQCRPEAKSGVDYQGHMLDGTGRAVYVEAKYWAANYRRRFPLAAVEPHQQVELDRALADGCVSVLLLVQGVFWETFAVPWEATGTPQKRLISLNDAWLKPYFVPAGVPYLQKFKR